MNSKKLNVQKRNLTFLVTFFTFGIFFKALSYKFDRTNYLEKLKTGQP